MVVLVTGVSGVGKTTVGRRVAGRLGWAFEDADPFHPPSNVRKMRSGEPLTEADREPWLEALAAAVAGWRRDGRDVVLACSALKRAHRERLGAGAPDVRVALLQAPADEIRERMLARRGHFMPARLLASQLHALEAPAPGEPAVTVSATGTPEAVAERLIDALDLGEARSA